MSSYDSDYLPSNILGDKYQIERKLADKGAKKTLLGRNIEQDKLVVIKLLTFGNEVVWSDFKLFEREAETLKSLSHPAIPRYIDYFEIDTEQIKGFALIQSYIPATSLAEQIKSGRNFSEAEVKQLAQAILEILKYLHSCQPSVIHRDIKPSNILLSDRSGNSVGQVY
ncbi:MAG: protein kinase, partial [Cyanobacteria bacterium P01_A01_bin.83]